MAHQLSFEHLIRYDPGEAGVTIDVALKLVERSVSLAAKVDTGSSYCIFERKHCEALGLSIESGLPQPISTVTGRFITYGHQITSCVADFEFDSMIYFAADEAMTYEQGGGDYALSVRTSYRRRQQPKSPKRYARAITSSSARDDDYPIDQPSPRGGTSGHNGTT